MNNWHKPGCEGYEFIAEHDDREGWRYSCPGCDVELSEKEAYAECLRRDGVMSYDEGGECSVPGCFAASAHIELVNSCNGGCGSCVCKEHRQFCEGGCPSDFWYCDFCIERVGGDRYCPCHAETAKRELKHTEVAA